MELRNHTTHALEMLQALVKGEPSMHVNGAYGPTTDDDRSVLAEAYNQILAAPKFALPDHGRILEERGRCAPDELRLPFPDTVIEYDAPYFDPKNPQGKLRSSRRVVLAREIRDGLLAQYGDILVWPMFYIDAYQAWSFCPWAGVIRMESTTDKNPHSSRLASEEGETFTNANGKSLTVMPIPYLPSIADAFMRASQALRDETLRNAVWDLGEECCAVAGLVEVLACNNVRHEVLREAPERLNAKRAKSGKPPMFEYRVLTIDVERNAGGGHGTGTSGRTVRQHLRRGHIRRLASGRTTFVKSTVVGAGPGRLTKDYAIRT